jgi:hypothetical protein
MCSLFLYIHDTSKSRSKHLKQTRQLAADANRLNDPSVVASASSGGDNSMVDENPESESESESTEVEEVSVGAEFTEIDVQSVCIFDTECYATHTVLITRFCD